MKQILLALAACTLITLTLVWIDSRVNQYVKTPKVDQLEALQASIFQASEPQEDIKGVSVTADFLSGFDAALKLNEEGPVDALFGRIGIAPLKAYKKTVISGEKTLVTFFQIDSRDSYPIILTESYNQQDTSRLAVREFDTTSFELIDEASPGKIRLVLEGKDSILALTYGEENRDVVENMLTQLHYVVPELHN